MPPKNSKAANFSHSYLYVGQKPQPKQKEEPLEERWWINLPLDEENHQVFYESTVKYFTQHPIPTSRNLDEKKLAAKIVAFMAKDDGLKDTVFAKLT